MPETRATPTAVGGHAAAHLARDRDAQPLPGALAGVREERAHLRRGAKHPPVLASPGHETRAHSPVLVRS